MKKRWLISVILLIIVSVTLSFSWISVQIVGDSMAPSIANDARVLGVKPHRLKRFDVVSFYAPDNPSELYIKRIIGMPGDLIEFEHGILFVSGQAIDETYLNTATGKIHTEDFSLYDSIGQLTVPDKTVFVLGDNRSNSNDSRYFGFVPKEAIEYRATFIFWPPSEMGAINSTYKLLDSDALTF